MSRKKQWLAAVITAIVMSAVMTLVMTWWTIGIGPQFLRAFLEGWLISTLVAVPVSYVVPPKIIEWVEKI